MDATEIKQRMLAKRTGLGVVDVEGIGKVQVRGLTKREHTDIQEAVGNPMTEKDMGARRRELIEQKTLAKCMIEPAMTEKEVAAWQEVAPAGEIEPVMEEVMRLSKLLQGDRKEAYKSTGRRPRS